MNTQNIKTILAHKSTSQEEKEIAFLELQKFNIETKQFENIKQEIRNIKSLWEEITVPRITKLIKRIFDMMLQNTELSNLANFLDDLILWAKSEDRNFLRLDLESKRIFVNLNLGNYYDALIDIKNVIKDLKKFDDRNNLILIYVYESKAYYKIKDFSKAKSSLTSARALAVSAYCSYELQAQIDLYNGMYLCDERNYETAFSYFLESLNGFTIDKKIQEGCVPLRYFILSKIISNRNKEIDSIFNNKMASVYLQDEVVKVLLDLNKCCVNRDLRSFLNILEQNKSRNQKSGILEDEFMRDHLQYLYDLLLEKNILKIIEVYSSVYLQFIATELNFEVEVIEQRIRNMILDGSINGILDHNEMLLVLYEKKKVEEEYFDIEYLKKMCSVNN